MPISRYVDDTRDYAISPVKISVSKSILLYPKIRKREFFRPFPPSKTNSPRIQSNERSLENEASEKKSSSKIKIRPPPPPSRVGVIGQWTLQLVNDPPV